MADEVLDFLRVNFARLNDRIESIEADLTEFRERLGHIEGQVAGILQECTPRSLRGWTAWTDAWSVSSADLIWSKGKIL